MMTPAHTILHPTDFSDTARHALDLAGRLAWQRGARLIIVHVMPYLPDEIDSFANRSPEGVIAQRWEELLRVRPDDPRVNVEHRLERGDAAFEIVRLARETKAGLIVMGTHGRTGRRLPGSVVEDVLRAAPCPVLTIQAPVVGTSEAAAARL
jgi:nucleotide-binding universal stress UspA family protein